jgi:hypothetical protein
MYNLRNMYFVIPHPILLGKNDIPMRIFVKYRFEIQVFIKFCLIL